MYDLVGNLEGRFSRDVAYLEGGVQCYRGWWFCFPFCEIIYSESKLTNLFPTPMTPSLPIYVRNFNVYICMLITMSIDYNVYCLYALMSIILSQTYNATLFSFDYFYVNAHALNKLFPEINSSFNQASNHILVLTICLKLAKKQ